jgi:hypothetical protein
MADLQSVEKGGTNKEQGGYKYMEAADLLKALRPLLALHGLVLMANPAPGDGGDAETSVGLAIEDSEYMSSGQQPKTMHYVRLRMDYLLINVDNPEDRVPLIGISDASDVADKAIHKCRTSALKYMLRDNFMVDAQDDADADQQTHERGGQQQRMQRTQQQAGRTFAGSDSYDPPRPAGTTTQRLPARELEGVVMEATIQSNPDRVEFHLNNFADPILSFIAEHRTVLADGARVKVRIVQNTRDGGGYYWRATDVTVVQAAPPAKQSSFADEMERAQPTESARQILARMFPTPEDVKLKRLTEAALESVPEDLRAGVLISFDRRLKSEQPVRDTGKMALLDISIQEAKETAELAAAERD